MVMNIKQVDKKWRIRITEEEWEFESYVEMKTALDRLLHLKEMHGQLR